MEIRPVPRSDVPGTSSVGACSSRRDLDPYGLDAFGDLDLKNTVLGFCLGDGHLAVPLKASLCHVLVGFQP
jgi:hypothetical protein